MKIIIDNCWLEMLPLYFQMVDFLNRKISNFKQDICSSDYFLNKRKALNQRMGNEEYTTRYYLRH